MADGHSVVRRKNGNTPRRKRMNKESRLNSARDAGWVAGYQGKNLIKGYSNWFGVDLMTAVRELRLLGVEIDAAREAQIAATVAGRAEEKRRRRAALAEKSSGEVDYCRDGTFGYIAGYTEGEAEGQAWTRDIFEAAW